MTNEMREAIRCRLDSIGYDLNELVKEVTVLEQMLDMDDDVAEWPEEADIVLDELGNRLGDFVEEWCMHTYPMLKY